MKVIDDDAGVAGLPAAQILEAIAAGEIRPHYQPIVSLESGDVVGVEALARWSRPGGAMLAAPAFVPILEHAQQVGPLTACMLDRACADLATWRSTFALSDAFRVSINVSATELSDRSLIERVRAVLDRHGTEPASLCLEVTESARIDDTVLATEILSCLSDEIGVRLAVDDYGAGFSNRGYLTGFPFDTVKIDQSFIAGMEEHAEFAAFVHDTIGYAQLRSLGVVAEGIESRGQADALRLAGCTLGQGFGLGRPCPADQVTDRRFGADRGPLRPAR